MVLLIQSHQKRQDKGVDMSWSGITIDLFTNTVAILNSIVSNSYYEEPVHLEAREDFRQQLEAITEATKVHKCFFVITAGILSVCIKVYSFPFKITLRL